MSNERPLPLSSSNFAALTTGECSVMLLGPSHAMLRLWSQIRLLAPRGRALLLTGAPDCGQEAVARLLLHLSPQPHRPFVRLGPAEGDERVVFTRSNEQLVRDTFYFVPCADRLPHATQEGLVRLLRNRSNHALSVVAATETKSNVAVSLGHLLPELANILEAEQLALPTLSERSEDLPMLLEQMIYMGCKLNNLTVPQISAPLLHAAMKHPWAGNLRELTEVVNELLKGPEAKGELGEKDWARALRAQRAASPEPVAALMRTLDEVVQAHIYGVLVACQGNKSRAAEVLGISRSTLYRLLEGMGQSESPLLLAS